MSFRRSERRGVTTFSELQPPLMVDPLLAGAAIALVVVSLVMIYSTTGVADMTNLGDAFSHLKRQALAAVVGVAGMFLMSKVSLGLLQRLAMPLYLLSVFLLLMTLMPGIGDAAGGAQRWIRVGPLRFQPAEFAKLSFVLAMASYVARRENVIKNFKNAVVKPVILAGALGVPLLLQPDFGSTVVIFSIAFALCLVSGARMTHMGAYGAALVPPAVVLVIAAPYRLTRVLAFLDAEADPSGDSYQLRQSLIAIGNGGFFGVGLGNSQQKLRFLPAAHTDFIFAVIGEELGLIGCVLLMTVFCVILLRGLFIASTLLRDTFAFALAVGMTLYVVLPAFVNIGVVTGLLSTKGIALPLVSYGGSSMIASLAAVGILLAVARTRYQNSLAQG